MGLEGMQLATRKWLTVWGFYPIKCIWWFNY